MAELAQTSKYDVAARTMPTYRELALKMREVARARGEWAGIPMPVSGLPMHLEKKYPIRYGCVDQPVGGDWNPEETPADESGAVVVNSWWSSRLRAIVHVVKDKDGKRYGCPEANNQGDKIIGTIGASIVWPLEAEAKAIQKLAELISNHAFLQYMLTGSFIESSKRSGVFYVFRKLRPTLALRAGPDGAMRMLCGLCLHPIGYYAGTWAGVMTPTDDVIAHVCMMRGDEPKFWANANQHPPQRPEAGI